MSICPKKKVRYRLKTCLQSMAMPEALVWTTVCTGDRDEIEIFLEVSELDYVKIEVFSQEKGWVDITGGMF